MRRIFTLTICVLSFASLHAQIKKGSTFLGGNLGASTQKTKSADTAVNSQKGFLVSPVFGKAIKDNLVFGGTSILAFLKTTIPEILAIKNKTFMALGCF